MVSSSLKISMLTAVAVLAATTAQGADYAPPPPQIVQPPPQEFAQNWYLRGFVGVGMTNKFKLDFLENPAHTTNFVFDQNSNSDRTFVGGGVGYEWNNWLRFDLTGEYRSRRSQRARHFRSDHSRRRRFGSTRLHQILGVPRQRICRSRHLELLYAIRRLRHRRRLQHIQLTDLRRYGNWRNRRSSASDGIAPNGISPGRCTPVSATT